MDFENRLSDDAKALFGIELSGQELQAFKRYMFLLSEWNQKFNLTAIRDKEDIRVKHFLDSLSCLKIIGKNPDGNFVDVGSGAGFPGLPLKIVCPDIKLTLIESIRKKTNFLSFVVQDLRLKDVSIICERVEKIGNMQNHRASYDWALARSVASLPTLLEYLLPLVKVGGFVLAQKGEGVQGEVKEAEHALSVLGGKVVEIKKVKLSGIQKVRYLVSIEKTKDTPDKYPRRSGIPSKRSL